MVRVQRNLLAKSERRLLDTLCARIGDRVSPDQMTLTGAAGGVLVLCGYAAGRWHLVFTWLAVVGYLLHWLGDSLDGALARHQGRVRPRYGFLVDHGVDALSNSAIMFGLGLSGFVRMDVALAALGGYLALTIYVLLRQHAFGQLQLSFLVIGPTELRIGLAVMTGFMILIGRVVVPLGRIEIGAYDLVVGTVGALLYIVCAFNLWQAAATLRAIGE